LNQLKSRQRILVGICGRAGAGKTTMARNLFKELIERDIDCRSYSGDWRFILDSSNRKRWLEEKWRVGIDAYMYAINQFNWWDLEKIYEDLNQLLDGKPLELEKAYDRKSGKKDLTIRLPAIKEGVICFENCVLGGVECLEETDVIVLLSTPDKVCFERVMNKDAQRRSLPEIATRYLITTYSENIFLKLVLEKFRHKLVTCDSHGALGGYPEVNEVSHIPVPIGNGSHQSRKKGTVFCDLDGTIIKHVQLPTETGEEIRILQGSVEKLREFREKDYFLVLTTSRPQSKVFVALEVLKREGIEFDQVICDLPVGPRHLINDSKDTQVRAIVHALERDSGIKDISLP